MSSYLDRLKFWGAWWVRLTHPLTIFGDKNFCDKKQICVMNHQSNWDAPIWLANIKGHPKFLYKAEFEKTKFVGKLFRKLDFIPIHRGEVDTNATKMCLTALKNDNALFIFPEGTRNRDCTGNLLPFKEGTAMLAIKTKSPLKPYYVKQPFNKKGKVKGRAYMIVGKEFELSEFYDKKIDKVTLQTATQIIQQKVQELKFQLDDILKNKKGK